MKKYVLAGSALAFALALGIFGAQAGGGHGSKAVNNGVIQTNTFGEKSHPHANNIRLCNNRCTVSGDYAGNIVGIGNQNLGPTITNAGKGGHKGHDKGWR